MKKLLFVDHEYHKITNSSKFFVAILAKHFEVEVVFVRPESEIEQSLIDSAKRSDIVFVWQMDFLAPVFLGMGLPTVVAPMFDGSSQMPDLHWLWMKKASFINFSYTLHNRIQMLGGRSMPVKYFPTPAAEKDLARFEDGISVFLWHRRPEEGINLKAVESLFGSQLKRVHIHNAPDNKEIDAALYSRPSRSDYELTVSTWFEDAKQFHNVVKGFNTFIAPRFSEGIGMAFLEAMARGMLVVATDFPTHSEYIANWINGVLFNPANVSEANFEVGAGIGKMAWRTCVEGHQDWLKQGTKVRPFLLGGEKPECLVDDPLEFANSLSRAYFLGGRGYASYLQRNVAFIERMSGQSILEDIDSDGNLVPINPGENNLRKSSDRAFGNFQWLSTPALKGSHLPNLVMSGAVEVVKDVAWIVGNSLEIGFRVDPSTARYNHVALEVELPDAVGPAQIVVIALNDWTLESCPVQTSLATIDAAIPARVFRAGNVLRIQTTGLGITKDVSRPVSVGVKAIRFY